MFTGIRAWPFAGWHLHSGAHRSEQLLRWEVAHGAIVAGRLRRRQLRFVRARDLLNRMKCTSVFGKLLTCCRFRLCLRQRQLMTVAAWVRVRHGLRCRASQQA